MEQSLYSGAKHKAKIIKLFRSILRERLKLPTENRREFVLHKARTEFRDGAKVTDPKEIRSLLIIGNTHLDTVMIQAKHLSTILEYEPTPIELRHQQKQQGTAAPLTEEEKQQQQKTLTINQEYLEKAKMEQKLSGCMQGSFTLLCSTLIGVRPKQEVEERKDIPIHLLP